MGIRKMTTEYSTGRTRHLVFLAHVWLCIPFMLVWLNVEAVQVVLGKDAVTHLQPMVVFVLLYMVGRTWLAMKDPPWLRWEYVFPPIDVVIVSLILYLSGRGPMSNLSLLVFLPIVEATGTLKVRWAASVGLMVVAGMIVSTLSADFRSTTTMMREETLNVIFRLFFLILISSLAAYQASIAAEFKEKLGVVADRNRIALEMHDGVQGSLISLASTLELISHVAPKDGDRASQLAHEARDTARQAADELRFLVQRLRGPSLAQGFVPSLRQYAHNVCNRADLALEFTVEGEEVPIDPDRESALFRIAQEALNNIIKHSSATEVRVIIHFQGEDVSLTVMDNGRGFDSAQTEIQVGLQSMRERAERLGGKAVVTSSPGEGTKIEATL